MDLNTYRAINRLVKLSPGFLQSQDSLLAAFQEKIRISNELLLLKNQEIAKKDEIIARKDSVIQSVVFQYGTLEKTTNETLSIIKSEIKKDNKFFRLFAEPPFWIGIAIGAIGITVISN